MFRCTFGWFLVCNNSSSSIGGGSSGKCKYGMFYQFACPSLRFCLFRNGSNTRRHTLSADNLHKETNAVHFRTYRCVSIYLFSLKLLFLIVWLPCSTAGNLYSALKMLSWEVQTQTNKHFELNRRKTEEKEFYVYFSEVIMALNCPLLFAVISFILISMEFFGLLISPKAHHTPSS